MDQEGGRCGVTARACIAAKRTAQLGGAPPDVGTLRLRGPHGRGGLRDAAVAAVAGKRGREPMTDYRFKVYPRAAQGTGNPLRP